MKNKTVTFQALLKIQEPEEKGTIYYLSREYPELDSCIKYVMENSFTLNQFSLNICEALGVSSLYSSIAFCEIIRIGVDTEIKVKPLSTATLSKNKTWLQFIQPNFN